MIAYLDAQQQQRLAAVAEPADSSADAASAAASPEVSVDAPFDTDFGGLVRACPAHVVRPASTDDVRRAVAAAARRGGIAVAARGNGHSVAGQATAEGGLVLDMRALGRRFELVRGAGGAAYADVPGGALWEDVLRWAVAGYGLSPPSWTDYLRLTVGGTLSNGGVSGQAFKFGPQISNVAEMEIVTGDGECHVCSAAGVGSDLFFAVLGGLGQFGIITRARIPLIPAPRMVRWVRLVYAAFEDYTADAERLVAAGDVDYVEGFAFVNNADPADGWPSVVAPFGSILDSALAPSDAAFPVLYCLELGLYHSGRDSDTVDEVAGEVVASLRHIRGLEFAADVGYVEFLSRVNVAEEEARVNGSWTAPHPWLNLFIASRDIAGFDRNVFKRILRHGVGGPMLVYPMLKSRWDSRTSVALPGSEVFYLVALLRCVRPDYTGDPPAAAAAEMIAQNREIVRCCVSNGYDFKLYLPHYESQTDWAQHFSDGWARFVSRKLRYDPLALLAPGQKIFPRRSSPP